MKQEETIRNLYRMMGHNAALSGAEPQAERPLEGTVIRKEE